MSDQKKLQAGAVAARYGKHVRTIDRWVQEGQLPQPFYINGFRYWDAAELDEHDRSRSRTQSQPARGLSLKRA
jgi:predicted DNA-binding transcriptional regulator AlpA